jgi:hypothetical protein
MGIPDFTRSLVQPALGSLQVGVVVGSIVALSREARSWYVTLKQTPPCKAAPAAAPPRPRPVRRPDKRLKPRVAVRAAFRAGGALRRRAGKRQG